MKKFIRFNLQRFDGEGAGAGDGGQDKKPGGEPTFSQADLDRIVGERLAREKEKTKDYDDLKKKAAAHDKAEAEKLSEVERLTKEKGESDSKAAQAIATANARLILSEMKLVASTAGIPADRLDAAVKLADLSGVKVADDGTITGAKEALEACLKANPFLKGAPGAVGSGGGNPGAGDKLSAAEEGKKIASERNKQQTATGGLDLWAKK